MLRQQGWWVHHTHSATEASYDRTRCSLIIDFKLKFEPAVKLNQLGTDDFESIFANFVTRKLVPFIGHLEAVLVNLMIALMLYCLQLNVLVIKFS